MPGMATKPGSRRMRRVHRRSFGNSSSVMPKSMESATAGKQAMSAMVGRSPDEEIALPEGLLGEPLLQDAECGARLSRGVRHAGGKLQHAFQPRRLGDRELSCGEEEPGHRLGIGRACRRQPGAARVVARGQVAEDGLRVAEDELAVDEHGQRAARVELQEIGRKMLPAGKHVDRPLFVGNAEQAHEEPRLVGVGGQLVIVEDRHFRVGRLRHACARARRRRAAFPSASGGRRRRRGRRASASPCAGRAAAGAAAGSPG